MPKQKLSESVLHDWVHELTFQMQALLLTGMRGPDENNKYNAAKAIVRYLRGAVIKPAGDWRIYEGTPLHIVGGPNNNDFMWGDYSQFQKFADAFWADHDEYPHHFIMHLIHCAQVVGYRHPNPTVSGAFAAFYLEACNAFHMKPEGFTDMHRRLNDFGVGIHNQKQDEHQD